jgi:single-stranded-DNA-specific exonuclease
MPELFERFGGHRQAAGLTLASVKLDEFRARLNEYACGRLTLEDLTPQIEIDARIDFGEINDRSLADIFSLAPFGCGNPAPLFVAFGAEVAGPPMVWKEKHLKVKLRQNGRTMAFKAWNFAARAGELKAGARIDAAFKLEEDQYSAARGYPGWAAVLKDFRPTR